MHKEKQTIWYRIFHPIAKEFQVHKFCLSHEPIEDFFKSQVPIEAELITFKEFNHIIL